MDIDESFEEKVEIVEIVEQKCPSTSGHPLEVAKRNSFKEFLLDPSSGNFSMSRLCMGVVVGIFMPVYFVFYAYGVQVPPSIIVSSLASLATVYGLNSAFGSFYGRMRRESDYSMGRMVDGFKGERDYTQPSSQVSGQQRRKTQVGDRVIEEIER
jgi:hypothetical protein